MAVDTTQSWQEHTSDGSTAYFPFNFNYDTTRPGTIVVGKRTADNTYSVVDASNYELIPNASGDGGQIRFIQNPSGSQVIDDIPPAGTIVRIERVSVDTSSATWQIGLEMSELVNLFDRLFRLVQENKGGFDNVIKTFETQHNVSLYELLSAHNNHLLYWDNTTHTLTPTDFPKEDVVRCVNGLFFRISTTQAGIPYLEWSVNGSSDWHSTSATWGTIGGNINDQTDLKNALDAKQNTISDLATIRSGAAKGATAVQPGDLAPVATSGLYNDLTGKPTLGTAAAANIPDFATAAQGALATTAVQPNDNITVLNNNAGYITASYHDATKQDLLVDGTNIKTVNGNSLLGSGNITISGSVAWGNVQGTLSDQTDLKNALDLKADVATTYTKTEVNTALSGKANTSMDNLTATGQNIGNWSSNVSNCITNIPQDIKLELNNGTLTLKAGSKAYMPNGSGVFDTVTIASDITISSFAGSVTRFVFVDIANNTLNAASAVFSGSSAPTLSGTGFWYDTTNNLVKRTTDSGATWTTGYSFPICIVTSVSDVATSIDQVFNGFGYIGQHIFVFPNVSVSIPDGLNTDGSLKSIPRTNNALRVVELVNTTNNAIFITNYSDYVTRQTYGGAVDNISEITTEYSWYYVREENMYCRIVNGALQTSSMSKIIDFTYNGTIISDFKSKTVFRAVDYNDAAVKAGNNTFTGSNEFKETVKAPRVYGYGSDGVRTASLEFIDGGNDNMARLVAVSNNGGNAATADLHFNNGNPYFAVPSSDAVNAAVATLANTKAQNGYFKFSNGLIIQWGYVSSATSGSTITFPTAFSNTNYAITGSGIMDGDRFPSFYDRTTTNTKYKMYGSTSDISWIAIGY